MAICLCHESADHVLESIARVNRQVEPVSVAALERFAVNREEALLIKDDEEAPLPLPIHMLVSRASELRHDSIVQAHLCTGDFPDGSIKKIDEDVYTVSPELCLLQRANTLDFENLCQMLGRYMGSFSISQHSKKLSERPPLTSEEKLSMFLKKLGRVQGKRVMWEAMRWTCPFAASPQEVNLQLALTLPSAYHGFRLPRPHMNYEVELSAVAKRLLTGRSRIKIDLCWPQAGIGLEYQGEDHGDQLGQDYARHMAAHAMGYFLWNVAKEQMSDACQMDYLAHLVARRVRKKPNPETWPIESEVQGLLNKLNAAYV